MNEKVTWVLLTDGYYIRILFNTGQDATLNVYRESDFEKSSDITYKLITRYRVEKSTNENAQSDLSNKIDEADLMFELLNKFLSEKADKNEFNFLLVIAPQSILDRLNDGFPENVMERISDCIPGDYLILSQDRLEVALAEYLPMSG
jgi:protein required for attachment to host cells